MKEAGAPNSLVISNSSLRLRICRRMVLCATKTKAMPKVSERNHKILRINSLIR
ncbi:Uncharacterised protein [Mycobacteroides abscessus subsp. massiliense]|nr:Uncharacterised protein [Mycobacteroides abscessus subsp. massiliense]